MRKTGKMRKTGSRAYIKEIKNEAEKYGVMDQLILPGKINHNTKVWYYRNCEAFVFPSLFEGFGMPVIEAMRFGKPVFLSNLTSLPEIGGKEAYYWENFEPEYMHQVFLKSMDDFKNDIGKAQRIIEHSKKFLWENIAKQYIKVYQNIIEANQNTSK